jgi:hypothetical protein
MPRFVVVMIAAAATATAMMVAGATAATRFLWGARRRFLPAEAPA